MLTAAEAALRIDFVVKVSENKKDAVSYRFREAFKARGMKSIRLEEDILDTWRDYGSNAGARAAVGEFKGVLGLRDWLVHGRYWKPKLGRAGGYDPIDVYEICSEMLQVIGLLPLAAAVGS